MKTTKRTFEINFVDRGWMIELGRVSRRANEIVLRNFNPTAVDASFINRIISESNLEVVSSGEELVLKRAG